MNNLTKYNKKIKKVKKSKLTKKQNYKKAGAITSNDAEQLWYLYNTNIQQFYSIIQNLGIFDLNHLTHLIPDNQELSTFKQEIYNEISRQNNSRIQSQQQQLLAFQQAHAFQQQQQQQQIVEQQKDQEMEVTLPYQPSQHLKTNGTLDMRYKENKEFKQKQTISPLSFNKLGKQPMNSQLNPDAMDFKPQLYQQQLVNRDDPKIMLTQHALQRMSERNITEAIIVNIIKQNQYEKGISNEGIVRIYKGYLDGTNCLYKIITSDDDNPTIITVIRDKFSESAFLSMQKNNIPEKLVLDIIEKNQPREIKGNALGNILKFIDTYGDLSITVTTNMQKSKIINVFVKKIKNGKKNAGKIPTISKKKYFKKTVKR